MAYENYSLMLSAISAFILLVGIYYTYLLGKKTGKASVVWHLLFFAFVTLFVYQFVEVVGYADGLLLNPGGSPTWLHAAFADVFKMDIGDLAENIGHAMPSVAAAVFICTVIVIRRSLLVPI